MTIRVLAVTAVSAERDAVVAGLAGAGAVLPGPLDLPGDRGVDVLAAGAGPASAAAGTAAALATARAAGRPYAAVVSLGIAGGFAGRADLGGTVIGVRSIAADLGAASPDGFLPIETLGFGRNAVDADADLCRRLALALPGARLGAILTVTTVTGTEERARDLATTYPDAVAEAMEGYGSATAADQAGVPFAEIRTVSNVIGPRDRDAWRVADALVALSVAGAAVGTLVR